MLFVACVNSRHGHIYQIRQPALCAKSIDINCWSVQRCPSLALVFFTVPSPLTSRSPRSFLFFLFSCRSCAAVKSALPMPRHSRRHCMFGADNDCSKGCTVFLLTFTSWWRHFHFVTCVMLYTCTVPTCWQLELYARLFQGEEGGWARLECILVGPA